MSEGRSPGKRSSEGHLCAACGKRWLTCGSGARGAHWLTVHVCLHMWGGVGIITPPVHRRAGRQHAGVRGGLAGDWGLRGEGKPVVTEKHITQPRPQAPFSPGTLPVSLIITDVLT